jgi:hypothetical protein
VRNQPGKEKVPDHVFKIQALGGMEGEWCRMRRASIEEDWENLKELYPVGSGF